MKPKIVIRKEEPKEERSVEIKKTKKLSPKRVREERKKLLQKLTDEVEENGVVSFAPEHTLNIDNERLILPLDITEVTSRELGQYLNAYTQQRMYMRSVYSWQQVSVEDKLRAYEEVAGQIYEEIISRREYSSETARKRYVNQHERVKEYYYEYGNEVSKLNLIKANIESLDDGVFLISREISRREKDFENENRLENLK